MGAIDGGTSQLIGHEAALGQPLSQLRYKRQYRGRAAQAHCPRIDVRSSGTELIEILDPLAPDHFDFFRDFSLQHVTLA